MPTGGLRVDPRRVEAPRSVLVVEDDDELRRVVVRHLTRWGFSILEAVDGGAAVDQFRRACPAPDAILLDIMLPVLDGVEVARCILADRPGTPIVAYSAAFNDQIEADLRELGVRDFLNKPFRADDLHGMLRRAMVTPCV